MSTHPDELLAAAVDGTLSGPDRAALERHLAACPACREDLALARAGRSAVRRLPEADPPSDLPALVSAATAGQPPVGERAAGERAAGERAAGERAAGERAAGERASAAGAGAGADERPAWIRIAGVAAVAAGLALAVLVLPRIEGGSNEDAADRAFGSPAAEGASPIAVGEPGSVPSLERSDADYSSEDLQDLALSFRTGGPQGLTSAEGDAGEALECLRDSDAHVKGGPVRAILARFEGTPAYFLVFASGPAEGRPATRVTIWVVSVDGCHVESLAGARLSG